MALDTKNLPPLRFIVPKTGHNLAASTSNRSDLIVGVFDPGKDAQKFYILPDGTIRLSNGKFTAPGYYESHVEIVNKEKAYQWIIMQKGSDYTITHRNGNVWTFCDPFEPIEISPINSTEAELQEFHMINVTPGLANNTTTHIDDAITAVPTDKLLITGAKRSPGPLPARLDVDTFVKNDKFLALYIQAIIRIHKAPEDQLTSYYQVAGLHGLPLVVWNQAEGSGSYCRHASPLFPTWHRPYVALFEQIVQKHALQIAEEYPTGKDEWRKAALDLRQPYWDWAKPGGATPPALLLTRQTLRIKTPKGSEEVENPLLYYQFKSDDSIGVFPSEFSTFRRTMRHPYSDNHSADIEKGTKNAQEKLTINTHALFSVSSWDAFSNKAKTKDGATNSLETIHDTLHVLVGRNGHFASACGAFDPLFFFHHAQIDRLLALWDVLQDEWVPGEEANEQLAPFWNSQSTYWTSKQIRNHEVFNHTYPELQNIRPGGNARDHVRKEVDRLYGDPSRRIFKDIFDGSKSSMTLWSVHFKIKPFIINQSFSLVVFRGSVPKDPLTWLASPELIGSYDVFISYRPEECENCRSHEEVPIEGFVHLTSMLRNKPPNVRTAQDVALYLQEKLYLGLIKVDNTIVDLRTIEFSAKVVSREVSRGADGQDIDVGQSESYPFDIKSFEVSHR